MHVSEKKSSGTFLSELIKIWPRAVRFPKESLFQPSKNMFEVDIMLNTLKPKPISNEYWALIIVVILLQVCWWLKARIIGCEGAG